ncbi:MAG: transposase [bacterium]
MPRGPRLDAPGALHHVIARGIERRDIFRDDCDRQCCIDRLARVITLGGAALYAWCLMPNHIHALIRSGPTPLSLLMRRWIGPYASYFNRRHDRIGHLFQNRFKSILVDETAYFLQLVRYIHLNPVRAGLCRQLADLDAYPWSGHATLLGLRQMAAQDVAFVLRQFGARTGEARRTYREFLETSLVGLGSADGYSTAGLRPTTRGWARLAALRRGREAWSVDEHVLGDEAFSDSVIGQPSTEAMPPSAEPRLLLAVTCGAVGAHLGISPLRIGSRSTCDRVLSARALVCHVAVCRYGLSLRGVARHLGISKQSVTRAVARADSVIAATSHWDELVRQIDAAVAS